jgi:uncharacterized protein (TIGR02217 family)
MTIPVYSDMIFPGSVIAAGNLRGKSMRQNSRVATDNGGVSINIGWTRTLREYELAIVPMVISQWQIIDTYYEVSEAGAYGFLLEDPKDNTVTLGVMVLVSAGVYQLRKRYLHAASGRYKDRTITRPRLAGFVPTLNGVAIDSGAYTLDINTGRITIPSAPAAADLAWTGRFYVPVHFMDDSIDWELVRSGNAEQRLLAGPTVVLREIRE